MSLTQVLISSGLLEKLVMKYITSQPSPSSGFIFTPLPPSSSSSLPSTPTSSDIQATITPTPSSDTYDTEVQKLFSLCLDLGDDENCTLQLLIFFKIFIFNLCSFNFIMIISNHNDYSDTSYHKET